MPNEQQQSVECKCCLVCISEEVNKRINLWEANFGKRSRVRQKRTFINQLRVVGRRIGLHCGMVGKKDLYTYMDFWKLAWLRTENLIQEIDICK